MPPDPKFMRGAIPTPHWKISQALASGRLFSHRVRTETPTQFAMVPKQLSYWLNNQYGDCVSAEEAAAVAAYSTLCGTEYFITDDTVKAFASKYSILNGADLLEVIQYMEKDGFHQGSDQIQDGVSSVVDYATEATLQNALSQGPVKLGMDASALPSGAGNAMGWTAFGGSQHKNEDHSTGLFGYGPTKWLWDQLNAVYPGCPALPSNAPPSGYLFYTWKTIGIVDHAWLMSCVSEAFLRTPTTLINGKPLTPTPPAPPDWNNIWP